MDGVGYDRGVSSERRIDPACGSGTFLVEAIERYLADVKRYGDDPDWKDHVQDLCTRPRVVGLDIRASAVLMAQIRFVVAILPAYREAKQSHPDIQSATGVRNFGEYFAALQGVLDSVKDHVTLAEAFGDDFEWTYQGGLEERIN